MHAQKEDTYLKTEIQQLPLCTMIHIQAHICTILEQQKTEDTEHHTTVPLKQSADFHLCLPVLSAIST